MKISRVKFIDPKFDFSEQGRIHAVNSLSEPDWEERIKGFREFLDTQ